MRGRTARLVALGIVLLVALFAMPQPTAAGATPAETVGVLAGTAGALPWRKVAVAAAVGNVVPAVA